MIIRDDHILVIVEILNLGFATTEQVVIGLGYLDDGVSEILRDLHQQGYIQNVANKKCDTPIFAVTGKGLGAACAYNDFMVAAVGLAKRNLPEIGSLRLVQKVGMKQARLPAS